MVYLDFRSLCLIIAVRRSGWGSGRRLVPYSFRFALTEPHRRHAAQASTWFRTALDLRSLSLIGAIRRVGRAVNAAAGRGGGAQVGGERRWGGGERYDG
jgi:hypothetical protein